MHFDILNALVGAFVVISGIAVIAALILGFKAIGAWTRNTFRGKDYPTREEVAEVKEYITALRAKKSAEAAADAQTK